MKRRWIAFAAGLFLFAGPMPGAVRATDYTRQDTLARDNSNLDSETVGDEKFVVRQSGKERYFDVYVHNRKLFTVKEQPVDVGGDSGYIDDYSHEFNLSPDHKYLFVEQKSVHCYGVGTLYGTSRSGRMRAIRPHGEPFDTAAIHAFMRVLHIPAHVRGHRDDDGHNEAFGDETRVIHFVRWTPGGVDFAVGLANFYCGDGARHEGDTEYDWSGHYDISTGRFTRLYVADTMTHAKYERELRSGN